MGVQSRSRESSGSESRSSGAPREGGRDRRLGSVRRCAAALREIEGDGDVGDIAASACHRRTESRGGAVKFRLIAAVME